MIYDLTSTEIERILGTVPYTPIQRQDKRVMTPDQKAEVQVIEDVVSFGNDIVNLFDDLLDLRETLPTQKQYVDAGINKVLAYLAETKPDLEISYYQVDACRARLGRTYASKVVELHLEAMFREKLPEYTLHKLPLMDGVLGVDLIADGNGKRQYIHVTSNTTFASKMLKSKEKRGGYHVGKVFHKYSRDFTGDVMLKYNPFEADDTTKIINGFPLFDFDFVKFKMDLASANSKYGEKLGGYTKLDHFTDWTKNILHIDILEGA